MNDDRNALPVPGWFRIAAIGALLWEILGAALIAMQAATDPATLPRDQQAIWNATPVWMNLAWGFAVAAGIAGAVLMLMRNRRAELLLLLSLLGTLVQFSGLLLAPALRELVASNDLLAPFIVILICYGIWHLARHARRSGWLR